MDRRTALMAAGAAIGGALIPPAAGVAVVVPDKPLGLRRIWKWYERTQEWVMVRMDTLKPGDRFDIEGEGRKRLQCVAKSHPRPMTEREGVCEIRGEQIGEIEV